VRSFLPKLRYPPRRVTGGIVAAACAVTTIVLISIAWWNAEHPVHRYEAPAQGEMLVSKDGHTLTIAASWGDCETRPLLVARENALAITVALRREDHSQPDHVCNNGGAAQITTSLGVSLGSHSVTDAVTGKRIQVFDGRHLTVVRWNRDRRRWRA